MESTKTIFISGHTDLSFDLFEKNYIPEIKKYFNQKNSFIIGGALGVDKFTQEYLALFDEKVTICDKGNQNNKFVEKFDHKNGFNSFTERDAFMTKNSDTDIAFLRDDKYAPGSGTASNLIRRKCGEKIAKNVYNLLRDKKNKDKNYKEILLGSKLDKLLIEDIILIIEKNTIKN